jgi:hypothetical protein
MELWFGTRSYIKWYQSKFDNHLLACVKLYPRQQSNTIYHISTYLHYPFHTMADPNIVILIEQMQKSQELLFQCRDDSNQQVTDRHTELSTTLFDHLNHNDNWNRDNNDNRHRNNCLPLKIRGIKKITWDKIFKNLRRKFKNSKRLN